MLPKIILTEEQQKMLSPGSLTHSGGNTYRFLPWAYKNTDKEDTFEMVMLNDLPENVKSFFLEGHVWKVHQRDW